VNSLEGVVLETQYLGSTIAVAGLVALLAVALAGALFGYIADEEAKGRRIEWLEEPLAMVGDGGHAHELKVDKAA
jgi:hypothetical protein